MPKQSGNEGGCFLSGFRRTKVFLRSTSEKGSASQEEEEEEGS